MWLIVASLLMGAPAPVAVDATKHPDMVDAAVQVPSLLVDIRYATPNNFVGRVLYAESESSRRCFLHRDAAAQLQRAAALLKQRAPELRFLAYDCMRPVRVQRAMWEVVKGTPQAPY